MTYDDGTSEPYRMFGTPTVLRFPMLNTGVHCKPAFFRALNDLMRIYPDMTSKQLVQLIVDSFCERYYDSPTGPYEDVAETLSKREGFGTTGSPQWIKDSDGYRLANGEMVGHLPDRYEPWRGDDIRWRIGPAVRRQP